MEALSSATKPHKPVQLKVAIKTCGLAHFSATADLAQAAFDHADPEQPRLNGTNGARCTETVEVSILGAELGDDSSIAGQRKTFTIDLEPVDSSPGHCKARFDLHGLRFTCPPGAGQSTDRDRLVDQGITPGQASTAGSHS